MNEFRARATHRIGLIVAAIASVVVAVEIAKVERHQAAVIGFYEWPSLATVSEFGAYAFVVILVSYVAFFLIASLVQQIWRQVT